MFFGVAPTPEPAFAPRLSFLRPIPDVLHPPVHSREDRQFSTTERVDEGGGGSVRLGVFHRDQGGQLCRRPLAIAVAELVHPQVVTQESDQDVVGQWIDERTDTSARVAVGNSRQSSDVRAVPLGLIVMDLVHPVVLPHQVDIELFRGRVHEAHGRGDGVIHRRQGGQVVRRPAL